MTRDNVLTWALFQFANVWNSFVRVAHDARPNASKTYHTIKLGGNEKGGRQLTFTMLLFAPIFAKVFGHAIGKVFAQFRNEHAVVRLVDELLNVCLPSPAANYDAAV